MIEINIPGNDSLYWLVAFPDITVSSDSGSFDLTLFGQSAAPSGPDQDPEPVIRLNRLYGGSTISLKDVIKAFMLSCRSVVADFVLEVSERDYDCISDVKSVSFSVVFNSKSISGDVRSFCGSMFLMTARLKESFQDGFDTLTICNPTESPESLLISVIFSGTGSPVAVRNLTVSPGLSAVPVSFPELISAASEKISCDNCRPTAVVAECGRRRMVWGIRNEQPVAIFSIEGVFNNAESFSVWGDLTVSHKTGISGASIAGRSVPVSVDCSDSFILTVSPTLTDEIALLDALCCCRRPMVIALVGGDWYRFDAIMDDNEIQYGLAASQSGPVSVKFRPSDVPCFLKTEAGVPGFSRFTNEFNNSFL